jgi:hypothetical protein
VKAAKEIRWAFTDRLGSRAPGAQEGRKYAASSGGLGRFSATSPPNQSLQPVFSQVF